MQPSVPILGRWLTHDEAAFAVVAFCVSLLNSLFNLYYVEVFLTCWKLPESWFYTGQVFYLVWNAINDPLFGWLQDRASMGELDSIQQRARSIFIAGPLFALAFLLPWFPWANGAESPGIVGLHFIVSLFCYDAMFTFVGLAHCAVFADIEERRGRVLAIGQAATILSAAFVFVAARCWHPADLRAFRLLVLLVAAIAVACCWLSAHLTRARASHRRLPATLSRPPARASPGDVGASPKRAPQEPAPAALLAAPTPEPGALQLLRELVANPNFLRFVAMNLVQVFHLAFNANFFNFFQERLLGDALSPTAASIVVASSFVLPQLLALALSPLTQQTGDSHHVILAMFWVKLGLSLLLAMCGQTFAAVLLFLVLNKSLTEATFAFFNMSVSDLVDEDFAERRRARRLGSTFFGTNALFTKPGQSLAPMLVVALLPAGAFSSTSAAAAASAGGASSDVDTVAVRAAAFRLLWLLPALCAVAQLAVWQGYQLHGRRLRDVKQAARRWAAALGERQDGDDVEAGFPEAEVSDEEASVSGSPRGFADVVCGVELLSPGELRARP